MDADVAFQNVRFDPVMFSLISSSWVQGINASSEGISVNVKSSLWLGATNLVSLNCID